MSGRLIVASRLLRSAVLALAAVALLIRPAGAQKGPALPDILQAAADYVLQYSQRLSVIAADEEYTQQDLAGAAAGGAAGGAAQPTQAAGSGQLRDIRRLNSDFVLIGLGDAVFAGFRDVYAKDTNQVRDRQNRLLDLFTTSPGASLTEARRISDDGVRYYFSKNLQPLDEPTLALGFLRKQDQARSTFKLDSVKTTNGAEVAILKFTERKTPRLISVSGEPAASGRFWLDTASGAVKQTELILSTEAFYLKASVTYGLEPTLGLWLPTDMSLQSDISGVGSGGFNLHQSLEAHAKYTRFRQVVVDTSKIR